jgi:integrase
MSLESKKLLDQVRETIRLKHYSRKTEKTYVSWIRRFILFHGKKHPQEMGEREIETFLSHLAVNRNVAASTQNQAFNAILFLYRTVLGKKLDDSIAAVRAKKTRRLPAVLSRQEAHQVIDALSGTPQLVVKLLYGSGVRLMECLRLRIKDVDFARGEITIRGSHNPPNR